MRVSLGVMRPPPTLARTARSGTAGHPAAIPVVALATIFCLTLGTVCACRNPHKSARTFGSVAARQVSGAHIARSGLPPVPVPSGKSRSPEATVPCDESETARCVARYARAQLSPADIKRFLEEGRSACVSSNDEAKIRQQRACLPLSLGVDARNGKLVELVGFGVEPLYFVEPRYVGVLESECCATGGVPEWTPGCFGRTYAGCSPPETLISFNYPRQPGGFMVSARTSPCKPGQILFADGQAMQDPNLTCKKLPHKDALGQTLGCTRKPRNGGFRPDDFALVPATPNLGSANQSKAKQAANACW